MQALLEAISLRVESAGLAVSGASSSRRFKHETTGKVFDNYSIIFEDPQADFQVLRLAYEAMRIELAPYYAKGARERRVPGASPVRGRETWLVYQIERSEERAREYGAQDWFTLLYTPHFSTAFKQMPFAVEKLTHGSSSQYEGYITAVGVNVRAPAVAEKAFA